MRAGYVILIILGLLGASFSFLELAGASLPYQDATPQMLEQQSERIQLWGRLLLVNLFLLILVGWRLWRSRGKH